MIVVGVDEVVDAATVDVGSPGGFDKRLSGGLLTQYHGVILSFCLNRTKAPSQIPTS